MHARMLAKLIEQITDVQSKMETFFQLSKLVGIIWGWFSITQAENLKKKTFLSG